MSVANNSVSPQSRPKSAPVLNSPFSGRVAALGGLEGVPGGNGGRQGGRGATRGDKKIIERGRLYGCTGK